MAKETMELDNRFKRGQTNKVRRSPVRSPSDMRMDFQKLVKQSKDDLLKGNNTGRSSNQDLEKVITRS